jgi:hypothetical protein
LKFELGLTVNETKTVITDSNTGIEFCGAFLKSHRRLSHYSAYKITKKMFYEIQGKGGYFTMWMKKWVEWN